MANQRLVEMSHLHYLPLTQGMDTTHGHELKLYDLMICVAL